MIAAGAYRRHIEKRIRAGNTALPNLGATHSEPIRAARKDLE
jgi:hypothetical protein